MVIFLTLTLAVIALWLFYQRDMNAVRARLISGVSIVETPYGAVPFVTGGAGAPVLAIHGAGGGYDQGRLLAEAFLPQGTRWIAPSRLAIRVRPCPQTPRPPCRPMPLPECWMR